MIVCYLTPGQSPNSPLIRAIELDRPTRIEEDGSRWCDADAEPHKGSGKPAVLGIPLVDYCIRLPGKLA